MNMTYTLCIINQQYSNIHMGCTVRNRTWECCILCLLNLCMAVQVPSTLEIGLVPALPRGQYPGLFLMSSPARMVRPVLNLSTHTTETIGSFEQVPNM